MYSCADRASFRSGPTWRGRWWSRHLEAEWWECQDLHLNWRHCACRVGCIHRMWKGSLQPDMMMLWAWLQKITLLMLIELVNVQPICVVCDCAGALVLFYDTKNKEEKISRYSRYEMCVAAEFGIHRFVWTLSHPHYAPIASSFVNYLHHISVTAMHEPRLLQAHKKRRLWRITGLEDVWISYVQIPSRHLWGFQWLSLLTVCSFWINIVLSCIEVIVEMGSERNRAGVFPSSHFLITLVFW